MAAHIRTALSQLLGDLLANRVQWRQLRAALDLSTWTEDLDTEDWSTLDYIVNQQSTVRLAVWVGRMEGKYAQVWHELGEPVTREEWVQARWEATHRR